MEGNLYINGFSNASRKIKGICEQLKGEKNDEAINVLLDYINALEGELKGMREYIVLLDDRLEAVENSGKKAVVLSLNK